MRTAAAALLVALTAGCGAAPRYAVERPGLDCDRATRVAYRTMVEMGYTVTAVVKPGASPGLVAGTKPAPDGTTVADRVEIHCSADGVRLQPVEDALVPNYEFSRMFDYSFTSLVQRPDVEQPTKQVGLQVQIRAIPRHEAILDLGGVPTAGDAVPVRVTIRNDTDRAVAVDPERLELVRADGTTARALVGPARDAALAPGPAADRVRKEALTTARVPPHTTIDRFLVFPAGPYREARLSVEDVETEESDGFVTPVQ
jgi:hypothetical protein